MSKHKTKLNRFQWARALLTICGQMTKKDLKSRLEEIGVGSSKVIGTLRDANLIIVDGDEIKLASQGNGATAGRRLDEAIAATAVTLDAVTRKLGKKHATP
jgi:hypothetical protein